MSSFWGPLQVNIDDNPENWQFVTLADAFSNFKGMPKNQIKKTLGSSYEMQLEEFIIKHQKCVIRFAALDDNSISTAAVNIKYKSQNDDSKVYFFDREGNKPYYIYKGQLILFAKDRLTEVDGVTRFGELITDIWDDVLPNDLHNEGGIELRKGKKPEKLISRILELCTNEDDLVLDFFIGSGTSAAVALKLNRQFIGVEQLNYIEELPIVRLKNTIKGEKSGISKSVNWQGGGDFIYCELMKYNEAFMERIQTATSSEELVQIWRDMAEGSFLNWYVNPSMPEEAVNDFIALGKEAGGLEKQKHLLVELLDKNQLYVNLSEIDDAQFKVSAEDKTLNRAFYGETYNA